MVEGVSASDLERLDQGALVGLVLELVATVGQLRTEVGELRAANERLTAEVSRLRAEAGKNSGNSSKPSSRDSAAERRRQAAERRKRAEDKPDGGSLRRKGKQRGARGFGPKLSPDPDVVVDHVPERCSDCGAGFDGLGEVRARRQIVDLPEPKPQVTEHRAHAVTCSCGAITVGAFPAEVRAPVTYSPRVRAVVVYMLARQHIPVARVQESMQDLFGLALSPGAINSFYSDAARRLGPFIAALVALLKTLPVLHADGVS